MTGMIRILCVDDDPDIRAIAVISLGLDAGTEVRSAGSGTEALALLDDATWWPDIVLLDVMMPDMDGPSVLDRIRSGIVTDDFIRQRAKARGVSEKDYMSGNLLQREVTADDVAQAVLHQALALKTTADVTTVDGGNIAAALR